MNFLHSKHAPCIRYLVLILSFQFGSVFDASVLAQPQQPAATVENTDQQALVSEEMPEVVRSLSELKKLQLEQGLKEYKVDIEAQLIFAAPYWSVFFVQDGDHDAMISCTDAASWLLVKQRVGCHLRIAGIAATSPAHIVMSAVEILDSNQSLEAIRVEDLSTPYSIPMNRLIEVESETKEIFVSKYGTVLFTKVGDVPLELEVNETMDPTELLGRYYAVTVAQGSLALPPEPERKSRYVLRMMNKEQIRSKSLSIPPKQLAKRVKIHTGKVVYTDTREEIVIETVDQLRVVHSQFAFRLHTGDKIQLHEPVDSQVTEATVIQSSLIELLSNEPLSDSKSITISELLTAQPVPNRITTTAKVDRMDTERGVFNFQLSSEGIQFSAALPQGKQSIDSLGVRVGDLVSLTGAPVLDSTESQSGVQHKLKLFVASDAELKFLSTPTRLPLTQIATVVLAGCTLLGSALTWNWLLRRQVQLRTARLNEVTSHLRKAFEAVHEGVLVNDREQRISGFNKQFATIFGTQPTEGLPVNGQLSAIEDLLVNRVEFARIRQHIQDNKSPSRGLIELRSPNRTLQVFASAITDNDGSYQGNLWSFEDITEKLSLENKLMQSQKMEAVGQLSGGIAHDFNNLLTIIRGSIMMMKIAANTNAPSTEFAESAEIAVDRAAELTQHLLDFSRRSTLQLQTIDANVLLKRVYLMIRRSIDSTIEIDFVPTPQPTFIRVDVTRLEQVLINLCINARDALPVVGGRIRLSVECQVPSNLAVIVVEDNGSGISPEVQKRMFEPFFTTKQPGCGTGLGLSMAIGVIEQLGGSIECRSELGQGTTFQISLPLASPTTATESGNTSDENASIKPLRILLVDDEEQIRLLGRAILQSLGHQTVTAANGRDALDLLATDQVFDVVLLDLTMPVMSGKEAFQEMRRRWPKLPIAICSGYLVSVEDWVAGNEGRPPAILAKPYLPEELNQLLAELTRGPK